MYLKVGVITESSINGVFYHLFVSVLMAFVNFTNELQIIFLLLFYSSNRIRVLSQNTMFSTSDTLVNPKKSKALKYFRIVPESFYLLRFIS